MDRVETLKLEDRKFSTVPHPLLDMVPVGVATDSLEVVEYVLVHKDQLLGLKLSLDGESIVKGDEGVIKNQCTAWLTANADSVNGEFNISHITIPSADTYRIYFKTPMLYTNYAIGSSTYGSSQNLGIMNKQLTYVEVNTYAGNNLYDIVVFGGMTFDGRLYPSTYLYPSTSLFPERI